jgi:hypothetical protein
MHADHVYVQACQPATGHNTELMFRTCQGRKDYHGGPNHFASLDLLNRPDDWRSASGRDAGSDLAPPDLAQAAETELAARPIAA